MDYLAGDGPGCLVLLKCPKCEGREVAGPDRFPLNELDKRLRCGRCSSSSKSALWYCPCGHPWHLCGRCRQVGQRSGGYIIGGRKRKRSPAAPTLGIGQRGRESFGDLALDDLGRHRAKVARADPGRLITLVGVCARPPKAVLVRFSTRTGPYGL